MAPSILRVALKQFSIIKIKKIWSQSLFSTESLLVIPDVLLPTLKTRRYLFSNFPSHYAGWQQRHRNEGKVRSWASSEPTKIFLINSCMFSNYHPVDWFVWQPKIERDWKWNFCPTVQCNPKKICANRKQPPRPSATRSLKRDREVSAEGWRHTAILKEHKTRQSTSFLFELM